MTIDKTKDPFQQGGIINVQRWLIHLAGFAILMLYGIAPAHGQAPDWEVEASAYQNTMSVIAIVRDECVPSDDPNDMIGAFDITGEIRGVGMTNVNDNEGFITVYSNGAGEQIYFKVYDASTNGVYNIYNYSITYISDELYGVPDPLNLDFDSNPTGVNAGADQEIFDMNSAVLAASGTGTWSVVEGAGGSFANASDPVTTFAGVIGTSYILAWTLDNAGDCIGETDEVVIHLVKDEPENNVRTCSDGLDNDGDGIYDCADGDCGQPVVTSIQTTDPTPIDCSTTQADGSFTVNATHADSFSLDLGMMKQASNQFTNRVSGLYDVWMENSATGCFTTATATLVNTLDRIATITDMTVDGPVVLCPGLEGIAYRVNVPESYGTITWSYEDGDGTITGMGNEAVLDVGPAEVMGSVVAEISNTCNSKSAMLDIELASMFLCGYSDCAAMTHISTPLLESTNSPQVYQAGMTLTSDAEVKNLNYEFTAGTSLEFQAGFSVQKGIDFKASIRPCTK